MNFTITVKVRGDFKIISCEGEIDAESYVILQNEFKQDEVESQKKIIVDLSSTDYINSSGWGVFIGNAKAFRDAGGDIRLAGMQPHLEQVFKMLGFDDLVQAYDTVENAVKSF
jgi:anti-sigma B factor antagonist